MITLLVLALIALTAIIGLAILLAMTGQAIDQAEARMREGWDFCATEGDQRNFNKEKAHG